MVPFLHLGAFGDDTQMSLERRLFERYITKGRLSVTFPDGSQEAFGEGEPSARWVIRSRSALRKVLSNPQLNLGETYINGDWDVEEGSLHDLISILRVNLEHASSRLRDNPLIGALITAFGSINTLASSRRNVSHHYDLDESLFRAFLDKNMHYSCAYFEREDQSLEDAQNAKAQHILHKLQLCEGQHVLDIGCGWGSLAMHLAENAGVRVTGITLSQEQLRVARQEAKKRGLDNQVNFKLMDYREINETFDRVVSVGMFEHVGKRYYPAFFDQVGKCLKNGGVALLHTIGTPHSPEPINAWIRRHIFPGGHIPSLSEVVPIMESSEVKITDIEVLRTHYAYTLREWGKRFQAVRDEFAQSRGERFCRIWELYLVFCQTAFELGELVVFQMQLAKPPHGVPLTRDYMYMGDGG